MIKKIYRKEQFNPGILGLFINPFYFARKGLYENIKTLSKHIKGKTLDIGCGKKPYKELFNSAEYIGMDIEQTGHNHANEEIDIFYDGKHFPFKKNKFDSVIVSQVFEHVFNPDDFLKEINRVLKKDGILFMTVPFVWDEHEKPFDYARYSSFGLKFILEKNNFKIIKYKKSVNDLGVIFQLLNCYIYKKIITKNNFLNLFLIILLMAPINILGLFISKILPKNNDLYLDNIILARNIKK